MPAGDIFLDTNVLLYLHDRNSPDKAVIAADWLLKGIGKQRVCTNLQALNEVANALLRKRWLPSPAAVFLIVDKLSELGDIPISWREIALARTIHIDTSYSWWDSLLLASALELGCSHFLSEDLQDGQQIGDLTIINPFLHAPETILGPPQD